MTSQKYSGIFQSDFDPSHKTLQKEKTKLVKELKKDRKKNNKYRRKEQFIPTVSK